MHNNLINSHICYISYSGFNLMNHPNNLVININNVNPKDSKANKKENLCVQTITFFLKRG